MRQKGQERKKRMMANITKTQAKNKIRKIAEQLDELRSLLEEIQEEVQEEADEVEPYEGKDELTEQQEERQEWLQDAADTLETQAEAIRIDEGWELLDIINSGLIEKIPNTEEAREAE